MTSPGRQLLSAEPATWVQLHTERWPTERAAFQQAVGRVVGRALRAEPLLMVDQPIANSPARVQLQGVSPPDRSALDLPVPSPDEDGKPVTTGLDLQAVLLPVAVRRDPVWATRVTGHSWAEVTSLDAMLCSLILAPVMSELAAIVRVRAGEGPKSDRGRAEKLLRCRQAHEALGLRSELIDPLLDPTLDRNQVVEARATLVRSWSEHPPDLGARTMALLCGHLVRAYYGKARKDGTIQEARVITATTKPLLDATLRDWPTLIGYLGEKPAATDAQPVPVPDVAVPAAPPESISERLRVLQDWWWRYDERHAAQLPGTEHLGDLVPPRWFHPDLDSEVVSTPPSDLHRTALPDDLVADIDRLWATSVLPRHPATLITEPHPFIAFGAQLRPAVDIWQELAMTCWWLCFGEYARYSLEQLEDAQAAARRELEKLGAPIDPAVYGDLLAAGSGHDWLFELPRGLAVTITVSDEGEVVLGEEDEGPTPTEASAAFLSLRPIIDRHRRRWLDEHLERLLDVMWRSELEAAVEAYWKRYRGKGSAPTVKQALPDVLPAAKRWFGGDFGALAQTMGLDGPVRESPVPTSRRLPEDLVEVRRDVSETLRQTASPSRINEREASYRINQLAARIDDMLVYWQAAGKAPPRSSILGSGSSWLAEELFGCDADRGYELLLTATRDALGLRSHPAAGELEVA